MIADPRGVAAGWPDPRARALATIAVTVTLDPARRPELAPLTDDEVVHATLLSAFFGHLNRIADAVAVPLDYPVRVEPPHADPATPALAAATSSRAIDVSPIFARRAATGTAMTVWRDYVFERDQPLARRDRVVIAAAVGALLGHAVDGPAPSSERDTRLVELARCITLAPWQLDDTTYQPLRELGFDDVMLFDACVVASTAGMISRIALALG